jgi:hypothetical protein
VRWRHDPAAARNDKPHDPEITAPLSWSGSLQDAPSFQPHPMNKYHYADKDNKPQVPFTLPELKGLAGTGVIANSTNVILEGATIWSKWEQVQAAESSAEIAQAVVAKASHVGETLSKLFDNLGIEVVSRDGGGNTRRPLQTPVVKPEDRILRGGSWGSNSRDELASSYRVIMPKTIRLDAYGFRAVLARSATTR